MAKPEVIVNIDPAGTVTVSAFSLKSDTWQDFEYFLAEGLSLKHGHDERGHYRSLRAAHFNLYAHFEAVVHDLADVALSKRENKEKSLQARCDKIAEKTNIQCIKLVGRDLRNVITHPGKGEAKSFEELNHENLVAWARAMSEWLDNACEKLEVKRFEDTESLVNYFSDLLGTHEKPSEI